MSPNLAALLERCRWTVICVVAVLYICMVFIVLSGWIVGMTICPVIFGILITYRLTVETAAKLMDEKDEKMKQ